LLFRVFGPFPEHLIMSFTQYQILFLLYPLVLFPHNKSYIPITPFNVHGFPGREFPCLSALVAVLNKGNHLIIFL